MSRNQREGLYVGKLHSEHYRQKKEVIEKDPWPYQVFPSRVSAFDTFWHRPIRNVDDPEVHGRRFLRQYEV